MSWLSDTLISLSYCRTLVTLLAAVVSLGPLGCSQRSSDPETGPDSGADSGPTDADAASDSSDMDDADGDSGDAVSDSGDMDDEVDSDAELWPEPWDFPEGLGDIEDIPAEYRPLFVSFDVPPLPEPGPDDWLTHHAEPGQTFDEFVASDPNLPTEERNILYIQPLGDASEFDTPDLDELEMFYEAYFSMSVEILDSIDPVEHDITERLNPYDGQRQLLTTDILDLLIDRMPDDAYSLIAVTMIDLYPADDWNFVFGQASLRYRAGVFSFARYESPYYHYRLRRAFKVLAHETGHMFGILHCIDFHCVMNGANHLLELDASPIHLCPVDLRKLYWAIGFDPVERYRQLIEVYEHFDLDEEAEWLEYRLSHSGF